MSTSSIISRVTLLWVFFKQKILKYITFREEVDLDKECSAKSHYEIVNQEIKSGLWYQPGPRQSTQTEEACEGQMGAARD